MSDSRESATRVLSRFLVLFKRWLAHKFYAPRQIRNLMRFSKNWKRYQFGENPSALLKCIEVFNRMVSANQTPLDSHPLNCGFTLRIDFPDYHKTKTVEAEIEVAPGYEIAAISRDFSPRTIGFRLTEAISARDGKSYIFRSSLKLVCDALVRPSTLFPSLTRSFVVSVNHNGDQSAAQQSPLLTQFRFNDSLDFWSRVTVVKSNHVVNPRVNLVSIALLATKEKLNNPLIKLINDDFRAFFDFLAITSNTAIAQELIAPLRNTVFIRAIELIACEPRSSNSPEPLRQMMIKGSGADLRPIYSHNEFGFGSVSTLKNIEIWHERLVVIKNQIVCRENGADLRADLPAGLWMYKWGHSTIDTGVLISEPIKSSKTIDKAIAGFGRCDANWFHFNIETLPRILSASEMADRSVPVLVQSDIPSSAVDAIVATTGREVVRIESDFLRVNELVVAQAKSATMDSAFLDTITGDFTASALASVRESLLKALPPEAGGEKRIALLRQNTFRQIKNVKKVLSVLDEYGFASIDIGTLTLREQISVVNNAEVVVAQGGAAVTNMLFANENSRFLGLVGPAKNQSLFWKNFLNTLNIHNSFVIGHPVREKIGISPHHDFSISINELRTALQQL